MKRIIYSVPPWRIEQDPTMAGNDRLVRFHKHNGQRKLLDQIARWGHAGWDGLRWIPKAPQVPAQLLAFVEAHMREHCS